jgi:hypothetical protein
MQKEGSWHEKSEEQVLLRIEVAWNSSKEKPKAHLVIAE